MRPSRMAGATGWKRHASRRIVLSFPGWSCLPLLTCWVVLSSLGDLGRAFLHIVLPFPGWLVVPSSLGLLGRAFQSYH